MKAKGGNQRFEAGSSMIKFTWHFSAQQPFKWIQFFKSGNQYWLYVLFLALG